jgi:hypothetical protein
MVGNSNSAATAIVSIFWQFFNIMLVVVIIVAIGFYRPIVHERIAQVFLHSGIDGTI